MNINILHKSAPTTDKPNSEIEKWYTELETVFKLSRKSEISIIMRVVVAKVGEESVHEMAGKWGRLDNKNDRSESLMEFCQQHEYVITDTWFKLPPR